MMKNTLIWVLTIFCHSQIFGEGQLDGNINLNEKNILFTNEYLVVFIFCISLLFICFLIVKFFGWAKSITAHDNSGTPNAILGYNIAFDFLAWMITGLIIILSFVLLVLNINKDLIILILGISIGSVLTRTPSFKEK